MEGLQWVVDLVAEESAKAWPDIAKLSTALGLCEQYYTSTKSDSELPNKAELLACEETFSGFVAVVASRLHSQPSLDARGKVKHVADLIWSKLSGVFSKEVLHAQHVSTFCRILGSPALKGRRQLDCAGVATTTLAVLQRLSSQGFQDLAGCRLQVSEDHCWISLTPGGGRNAAVEVTTDTAAKRGLCPTEEAWAGWLYNGGHAVLCSPKMCVAALVASLNPAIVARQNTGIDSEEVQALQKALLQMLRRQHPEALYPAALCALADLVEIEEQDALDAALERKDLEGAAELCRRCGPGTAQVLFKEAIAAAALPTPPAEDPACTPAAPVCYQWYPWAYITGQLCRRAAFALKQLGSAALCEAWLQEAAEHLGSCGGASVLRRYRFTSADAELHKDVEGVMEGYCHTLTLLLESDAWHADAPLSRLQAAAALLTPLLELWDGVCCLYAHAAKPATWLNVLLKALKAASLEARAQAADQAQVTSPAMRKAARMWGALKPAALKPLFAIAEVEAVGRVSKRPKR